MNTTQIAINVRNVLAELPSYVQLVAAAKTRSAEEVIAAIDAGVKIVGYNYVQEAAQIKAHVDRHVSWHMIGHLQRNKAKKAVELFDMIETIDSVELAEHVNRHCETAGKIMPVLIEINSARETNKSGVMPENTIKLVEQVARLPQLRIKGLMTMGAFAADPDDIRSYFKLTKQLFDDIGCRNIPDVCMEYLSMGMSDSYRIAIEEGANMVRIGTALFGARYR